MSRTSRRKRGPVRAKKVTVDNIDFKSGLEAYMYKALKTAKIPVAYEGSTYTIFQGFDLNVTCYERCANGKGDYKDRGNKKILPITYTPDFVDTQNPPRYIIECKGNPNERFPMVWKLFKRYLHLNKIKADLFVPRNQKDCQEVIKIIQEKYY